MMKTGPIGKIKSKKEEISPKEKMLHTSFDFFNYLSEQLNEPSFSYEDMLNNPDELKYKLLNLQEKIQNVIESKNTNAIKYDLAKKRGKPEPFLSSFIEKIARTGGNDYGYSKPSYSNDSYKPSKEVKVNVTNTTTNPVNTKAVTA